MPTDVPDGYKLERQWSLTHFLIGVFGAMAILGVMAKIFTFETEIFGYLITWKPVVFIGFMGEACVFILMGMMREMQYVPVDDTEPPPKESSAAADVLEEDDALSSELKSAEEELSQEAKRLAQQIREVRKTLSGQIMVLEEFNELRDNLQEASDNLSAHSDMLGSSMEDLKTLYESQTAMVRSVEKVQKKLSEESEGLGDEIAETRKAMRTLREEFSEAAHRFEQFNAPLSAPSHSTNERNNGSNSVQQSSVTS
jgi:ABC-type transporter Mla subunit MlaD